MSRFVLTSESVSEGHPDKVADYIYDSALDACLSQDPTSKVAVETLVKEDLVVLAGEITDAEKVLLPAIEGCINTQALAAFRKNLPVVRSTLDHRSAIGAFALAKRAMLNGILLQHLLED